MIPAVRLGSTVFRLGLDQLVRAPAAIAPKPGSEWWELVLYGSLAVPERWAGPPHGDPQRWDWGFSARSLHEALLRHEHLQRVARNLTLEQQAALWQEASPEAAELRRVIARVA